MRLKELKQNNINRNYPKTILRSNISDIVFEAIQQLKYKGKLNTSRNGETKSLNNVTLILTDIKQRHLNLVGRTNNIFGTLGEMMWVMAGKDEIDPVLSQFVPRAKNYSDDGVTWHAAYGQRLWDYGQFHHILDMFRLDGLETRRATCSIFIPQRDLSHNYQKESTSMKDIPCNQWMNFYCDKVDDTYFLNLKVLQRSGDIIFGTGNINIPEFTFIQEMILLHLRDMNPTKNIQAGIYIHEVTNLHYYTELSKQVDNILKADANYIANHDSDELELKLEAFNINYTRAFFDDLYSVLYFIATKPNEKDYDNYYIKILEIFDKYKADVYNNSLFVYMVLSSVFLYNKVNEKPTNKLIDRKTLKVSDTLRINELFEAVQFSKFRNFEFNPGTDTEY